MSLFVNAFIPQKPFNSCGVAKYAHVIERNQPYVKFKILVDAKCTIWGTLFTGIGAVIALPARLFDPGGGIKATGSCFAIVRDYDTIRCIGAELYGYKGCYC